MSNTSKLETWKQAKINTAKLRRFMREANFGVGTQVGRVRESASFPRSLADCSLISKRGLTYHIMMETGECLYLLRKGRCLWSLSDISTRSTDQLAREIIGAIEHNEQGDIRMRAAFTAIN